MTNNVSFSEVMVYFITSDNSLTKMPTYWLHLLGSIFCVSELVSFFDHRDL